MYLCPPIGKYIVKYTVGETDLYFGGTATKEFEILRKEINPEVSGYEDSYTYTGNAFEPEQRFENRDESDIIFNEDFFGNHRGTHVVPGPFAELKDEIELL